jgi:hypothetical protein
VGYSAYGDFYGRESAKARRLDKLLQPSSFLQPLSVALNPEDWELSRLSAQNSIPAPVRFSVPLLGKFNRIYPASHDLQHPTGSFKPDISLN